MLNEVYEFFGIVGVGDPPGSLSELIPYLLKIVIGLVLVSAVFGTVKSIAHAFGAWRY